MNGEKNSERRSRCLDKMLAFFFCCFQPFQPEIFLAYCSFTYIDPMKHGLFR